MDSDLLRTALERGAEVGIRLVVAAVVLTAFALLGRVLRPLIRARLRRRKRPSYARVFSGLFTAIVTVVGSLIAATIAFPSVEVADVLASLGILSVAVGFAFKDVLENLLAGVLLILRDPFQSGDEVRVGDVEGTVEGITVRETLVRTFDGRRVLIPNAQVFTDVIEVQTHFPTVRSRLVVEVDIAADAERVMEDIAAALRSLPGVLPQPPPQVLAIELADGIRLECRYWTRSTQAEIGLVRSRAVQAIRATLVDGAIALPAHAVHVEAGPILRGALTDSHPSER